MQTIAAEEKMLENEKTLIKNKYDEACKKVNNSEYHIRWLDEKIKHSYQVLGAGNYIIKHEKDFQTRPEEFIQWAKIAILLHDIGRFEEVYQNYIHPNERQDHGLIGAEILRNIPHYNRPEIVLAVKHHGHLLKRFYEDMEYTNISSQKQKSDIKTILSVVMDSDKIANFQMMKQEREKFTYLFLKTRTQEQINAPLSSNILEYFFQCELIPNELVNSLSDYLLSLICWIFDLNYKTSFDFCQKLGLITNLLNILSEYNKDNDMQEKINCNIKNFLTRKYQQFKD